MSDKWPRETTLIAAVNSNPESFRDKRIYVCAYKEDLNDDQKEIIRVEQERYPNVDGFGWEVPKEATFICFWLIRNGGIKFDGFWESTHRPYSRGPRNSRVWFAVRVHELNGISDAGANALWRPALLNWDKDDADAGHIKLEKFVRYF